MLRKTNSQKGFTIIEVVITIAIGAAVMALVLNAVSGARQSQRNNARIADVGLVAAAINQYYGARNALPTTSANIQEALVGNLAYYPDDANANITAIFVANGFNSNSNAAGAFTKWGTAATIGESAGGALQAAFTDDHMGIVLEAGCNATFSDYEDGGIRELALIYKLEGQEGFLCREI